ncbi:acyl-coenzyme A synthetase/AMP-(fatty) acid ligase [Pelomonas saccharophila]|uniref:Acyl-coenzyme A synthetase/AMP-(Fatty) acid ligase n=1 Tax=Roseateles saccharophilus TaxID=304 RepID=A0ABU1YMZ9_ROSSA|nr:AMP-binding protein [Roseateles saccharophilus]MDR7269615.1 acyl-coenzyme A synthetase/AMP-(fatty) acid ligase [Roseateles saccharophilus]
MTPAERLASLLTLPPPDVIGWRRREPVAGAEFIKQAGRWQAAFAAHPGQRFALYFQDSLSFAAALFGVWQAGKQAWLPGDLTPASRQALASRVDGFAGDAPPPPELAPVEPASAPAVADRLLDVEAQQLVVFTSGSTGQPQALPKRLRQLFDEITALEQAFGATAPGAAVLASVSHQHVYGLLFRVLWPLATGRALQAQSLVVLEDLVELTPPGARAVLIASPAHLSRLPLVENVALDQVFSSGAPLPDAALPDCLRVFGRAPIEVYGSSETGGVAWRQRNPGAPVHWQALPGVEWRIEDEGLCLRSPHLDETGWMVSADRAAAVEGGFELRGRADRIVKIAEKRVSLTAVEAALRASPLLADLRLVPLTEPREQLGVVAVPSEAGWQLHDAQGKRALAEALRACLADVVERVALPRRFRFLPELPFNTQGKSTQARLGQEFDPRRPALRAIQPTEGGQDLTLFIDPALPQFEGHFPEHPILAGVVQLEWAEMFGRERFGITGEFAGMEALKFQRVITPDRLVTLSLTWAPGKLGFRYHSAQGQHASGRLLFATP